MFPIRDHNPSQQTPYVTYALIAVNIAVFLLTLPVSERADALWSHLAMYPLAVTHGDMLWGLVTHMFTHAGFMHLAGNLLFLWVFGDNLEDQMGHRGFLLFYLACGLAAAGAEIYANPLSPVPMVGASGAIAGVMGAYLLLFPLAKVDILAIFIIFFKIFTIPAWIVLLLWLGLQIVGGFSVPTEEGGVAYWAHAGGFVAGIVLAIPLFLRLGGTTFWSRNHGHPPHPEVVYSPSPIPRIDRRR